MPENFRSNLLIVDDDVSLIETLTAALSPLCRVSGVSDGQSALTFLETNRTDLILLDLNLPRRNGVEVISEISADPLLRGIPLVILTSSSQECTHLASEFHLPASRYLLKPLDWQKYLDSVREFDDLYLSVVARSSDADPA